MEDETKRELAEYKARELNAKENYPLSTEVQREHDTYIAEEINLRNYIDVLIRRKWVVTSCLAISVVVVAIASLLMTRVYQAEATIEIAPENFKITTFAEVVEVGAQESGFYETQYELIESKSLVKEVVDALNLGSYPEFAWKPGFIDSMKNRITKIFSPKVKNWGPKEIEKSQQAMEEGLIYSFLNRVEVKPDPKKSRLVDISFESSDPELAAKAVNTLVDKYIEWGSGRKFDATKAAGEFLEKKLGEVKAKLERAEEELSTFAKSADIVSLDQRLNLTYNQLAELNDDLSKAEAERLEKEALYREIQAANFEHLPQVMNNPSIQSLKEEYTRLKAEYDNMAAIYKPGYPKMKQLAAQIAAIQSDINQRINGIADSIKKDYQAALTKENILRQRTEEQKKLTSELNDKINRYKILEREVETNKSIYESLLQRLKETEVTSGIKATNIQVVDYASIPLFPYKPDIKLNMLLAILAGLVGGCFLAFILEHFDSTIKDEKEVKKQFPLPFLGAIPLANKNEIQDIETAVYINPKSLVSESFRFIRTSILYSSPAHPPRSLLVTSTQPREGKTTLASNLAFSFIEFGLKVALVDADLRMPRLHKLFLNNGNAFGLSAYLNGKIELPDAVSRTNVSNLDIIPSGPIPSNPAKLLGSRRMKDLVERLLKEYDHVIIDGATIMGFSDSQLLSSLVDGVLLVTSVGITQRQNLHSTIEEIQKVRGRIIGIILNRLESRRGKYGYIDYYSNEKDRKEEKTDSLSPDSKFISD